MIELRVLEILTERQLTKYWLQKHSGISYQNISKMVNNETTAQTASLFHTIRYAEECVKIMFQFEPLCSKRHR